MQGTVTIMDTSGDLDYLEVLETVLSRHLQFKEEILLIKNRSRANNGAIWQVFLRNKKIHLEYILATLGDYCGAGRQGPNYVPLAYPRVTCNPFPTHQQLLASCSLQVCSAPEHAGPRG